ncbi:ABC transporter permease [Robinsoniella peoriensis]|uniref:ABC transporter permease n=1 Tax=Robinsoniella peoriensis TaxID=180332 RepID=UPI00085C32A8|nr:ABC transporter permease [Robinsoniella peoriensis]
MNFLGNILYDSVYHATPILLCVLGGIFAYKANVLNIALEGIMLAGAFVSLLVSYLTGNIVLGYVTALVVCILIGLVFFFMTVTWKGNVIVVGLAINMLVPAVAGFVLQYMQSANITLTWKNVADFKIHIPVIDKIPILGDILSGHTPITYLAFIGIGLIWLLMYRTKFGIYVRVVGENEDAARNMGLNTNKYRYLAILLGAFCCSLAGINLALERMVLFTNNMTAGRGFIAIAAIYCGQGDPVSSALYAIVFGAARALAVNMGLYAGPAAALFDVVPYVVMSIVLTIVSMLKYRNNKVRGFH